MCAQLSETSSLSKNDSVPAEEVVGAAAAENAFVIDDGGSDELAGGGCVKKLEAVELEKLPEVAVESETFVSWLTVGVIFELHVNLLFLVLFLDRFFMQVLWFS